MNRLVLIFVMMASPLMAIQPDEVLDDPALEARARDISTGLRCLVCRNESIDESDAELARDLRILLRERLLAGDSDQEVVDFIVDRYGEYVLLKPTTTGANLMLWLAGPIMSLIAASVGWNLLRNHSQPQTGGHFDALSDEEQERLRRVLED